MLPLIVAAGVVWTVAGKRIYDYRRYRNRQNKENDSSSEFADAERNLYMMVGFARKREEERQRQQRQIIIKDSKVYLVKGGSDEWE